MRTTLITHYAVMERPIFTVVFKKNKKTLIFVRGYLINRLNNNSPLLMVRVSVTNILYSAVKLLSMINIFSPLEFVQQNDLNSKSKGHVMLFRPMFFFIFRR